MAEVNAGHRWWETPEFVIEKDGKPFYKVGPGDVFKRTGKWPVTEEALKSALREEPGWEPKDAL